jgi:hypothetical protein
METGTPGRLVLAATLFVGAAFPVAAQQTCIQVGAYVDCWKPGERSTRYYNGQRYVPSLPAIPYIYEERRGSSAEMLNDALLLDYWLDRSRNPR